MISSSTMSFQQWSSKSRAMGGPLLFVADIECRSLLRRFGKEAPVDEAVERRRRDEIAHGDERVEVGPDAVRGQRGLAGNHLLLDVEVVGGRRDLRRGSRVLDEDID